MPRPIQQFWQAWQAIAHCIGDFQSRWLLTVFYFSVLLPFAFFTQLFHDPLRFRSRPGSSSWQEEPADPQDLTAAGRQF